MAIPTKIKKYLEKHNIRFSEIEHKVVYTAHDAAMTMKKKLEQIGKTLLLKTDKGYAVVVLPASHSIDLKKLTKVLKAKKVEIAKEKVMKTLLDLKPGVLMPFKELNKLKKKGQEELPVYIDAALAKSKKIIIAAGTFTDSVELSWKEFLKATQGEKIHISVKRKVARVMQKAKKKVKMRVAKKKK